MNWKNWFKKKEKYIVEKIKVIESNEDVVVVSFKKILGINERRNIRSALIKIFPNNKILILDGEVTIDTIKIKEQ